MAYSLEPLLYLKGKKAHRNWSTLLTAAPILVSFSGQLYINLMCISPLLVAVQRIIFICKGQQLQLGGVWVELEPLRVFAFAGGPHSASDRRPVWMLTIGISKPQNSERPRSSLRGAIFRLQSSVPVRWALEDKKLRPSFPQSSPAIICTLLISTTYVLSLSGCKIT